MAFHIHEQVASGKLSLKPLVERLGEASIITATVVDEYFATHCPFPMASLHPNNSAGVAVESSAIVNMTAAGQKR